MKWTNKRHELEDCVEELTANLQNRNKYYIFGAGQWGSDLLLLFEAYKQNVIFIDNDLEKQGKKFKGIDVISLDDYLQHKDGIIVIAASIKNTPIIAEQLKNNKLQKGKDFWFYKEFVEYVFLIFSTYCYNKAFVPLAQISLTERCSLKCKKCAHGCFAVDNRTAKDLTLEQVYKSADSFFSTVDYILEFVLIGGEPLLYQQLPEAIQYIGKRYRKQMGIFCITTNGTIVPDDKVLKMCKQYNVLFRISNYSGTISKLKSAYERLTEKLQEWNIQYRLGKPESQWTDYGFGHLNREASEEELIQVFDACRTPCREVRENRYYFCVMARSVSDNMGFHVGQNDYLDLDAMQGEDYKKELLEFNLGYSEKGYLDMCAHCYGGECMDHPIPVAEQVSVL